MDGASYDIEAVRRELAALRWAGNPNGISGPGRARGIGPNDEPEGAATGPGVDRLQRRGCLPISRTRQGQPTAGRGRSRFSISLVRPPGSNDTSFRVPAAYGWNCGAERVARTPGSSPLNSISK